MSAELSSLGDCSRKIDICHLICIDLVTRLYMREVRMVSPLDNTGPGREESLTGGGPVAECL